MKLRSLILSFVLALGVAPVAAPGVACAGTSDSAVLVVDTGSSELRYCVPLPDGSTSGIGLIKLANRYHGLQYRLGFGGQAVCQLAGVGPESDDCFADHPNFWGYWHGDGSGGWQWASTGAGSHTVEPGDVEGWSWGSGNDGSTHQQPPATTFASVCPESPGGGGTSGGKKEGSGNKPSGGGGKQSAPNTSTSAGEQPGSAGGESPSDAASEGTKAPSRKDRKEKKKAEGEVEPETQVTQAEDSGARPAMASAQEEGSNGPGSGVLLAVLVAGGLGASGLAVRRRRGSG